MFRVTTTCAKAKLLLAIFVFWGITLSAALDKNLIYQHVYGQGDYLQYASAIEPRQIRLIFEIGSRDAIDAIQLGENYHCPVYAFECNPEALKICYHNTRSYPFVTIVPYACYNETKALSFYPVVESEGGSLPVNIGASSLLKARQDGCDRFHVQGQPITVIAVRLDQWMDAHMLPAPDLICMDTQGATLQVLKGLGKYLKDVKYIITEVYLVPSYEGEALYPEIKQFLAENGFTAASEPPSNALFCDVLFINSNK